MAKLCKITIINLWEKLQFIAMHDPNIIIAIGTET